jgi:hypothetical protein
MSGLYGEINSRTDFHRVLGEARALAQRSLAASPKNPAMQNIQRQLNAMAGWTDKAREPSEADRGKIDVGLVAARELSEATGPVAELAQKLFALNNYFEDWPSDEEAANSTEDD